MTALANHLGSSVLIRAARGSDGPALQRLAELDSRALPAGDLILAETDGAIVAALSMDTGEGVADPFRRTADVITLLAARARTLREAPAPHRLPRRARRLRTA